MIIIYYDHFQFEHYTLRTFSHTIVWHRYDLLLLRSFSLTNICPSEHNTVRTLSRTIFWHAILCPYNLFHLRAFALTNIIPYEHYPVRTLSRTIFWYANFFLRTLGIRTSSIRTFVRTPGGQEQEWVVGLERTGNYSRGHKSAVVGVMRHDERCRCIAFINSSCDVLCFYLFC